MTTVIQIMIPAGITTLRALRMSCMYMLYMMMVPCVKITWWIRIPAGWNNSPDLEDEDSNDYVYTVDREALIYSSAGWNSYGALRTSAAIATSWHIVCTMMAI